MGLKETNTVRFLSPLPLTEELANKGIKIFTDSIKEVETTLWTWIQNSVLKKINPRDYTSGFCSSRLRT